MKPNEKVGVSNSQLHFIILHKNVQFEMGIDGI